MAVSTQQIEIAIRRAFDRQIPQTALNLAARKMGLEHIKLLRKQLKQGIDGKGRRIKRLSATWARIKRQFARGKLPNMFARRSVKKKPYKQSTLDSYEYMSTVTEFATKGGSDYGAFTGQSLSSLSIKNAKGTLKNGEFHFEYEIYYSNNYSDKIIGWLKNKGRDYTLCLNNSTTGKRNQTEIKKAGIKGIFPDATLFAGSVKIK